MGNVLFQAECEVGVESVLVPYNELIEGPVRVAAHGSTPLNATLSSKDEL